MLSHYQSQQCSIKFKLNFFNDPYVEQHIAAHCYRSLCRWELNVRFWQTNLFCIGCLVALERTHLIFILGCVAIKRSTIKQANPVLLESSYSCFTWLQLCVWLGAWLYLAHAVTPHPLCQRDRNYKIWSPFSNAASALPASKWLSLFFDYAYIPLWFPMYLFFYTMKACSLWWWILV